jgi:hypothetical protein
MQKYNERRDRYSASTIQQQIYAHNTPTAREAHMHTH